MTRRISIGVNWQGEFDREQVFERVKIAEVTLFAPRR